MDTQNSALSATYNATLPLLKAFAPPMTENLGRPGKYELYLTANVTLAGRKFSKLYFAGLVQQKNYVAFYFMPVYSHPALVTELGPELRKVMKGKSCFHIKRLTPELQKQITNALDLGLECYKKLAHS